MSTEAPKPAKEPYVPKYEIAAGLHKGRKLEKFVAKRVRPTRQLQVISHDCIHRFISFGIYRKKANESNSFAISFVNSSVLCRTNDEQWN
jgi:hypothetical protein